MTGGLSAARLRRLHDVMAGHVDRGDVPGLVTVVARGGEAHVDAIGTFEPHGGGPPVTRETIFRIASMTKPMAAVAALALAEDCRLRLDEPVDAWLPELADRRVLRDPSGPLDDTVPAERPITARDLLTFRNGFGSVFEGSPPIAEAASELGVFGGPPRAPDDEQLDPDEWLRRLGTLPLMHQPGTRWAYNTGSEILGILLARVSGQPLGEVLRERVFAPLGMGDTGFAVPVADVRRLAPSYMALPDGLAEYDAGGAASRWASEPARPSCGGGLVSTADDVLAFARMLLDDGRPLLARSSVRAMTTDQLRPEDKPWGDVFGAWWDSHGWGLGTAVATRATSPWLSVGQHGWDGGLGTSYRVDPAEGLIAILLTQRGAFPHASPVYLDFWAATYAALR